MTEPKREISIDMTEDEWSAMMKEPDTETSFGQEDAKELAAWFAGVEKLLHLER